MWSVVIGTVVGLAGGAFLGLFGWIASRLVNQLDRVTANVDTLTDKVDMLTQRMDQHEAWHMLAGDHVHVPVDGKND